MVSRTSSVPVSAFRNCLDKAQYLGLEFSSYPLLFPNKKTETPLRVKLFIVQLQMLCSELEDQRSIP